MLMRSKLGVSLNLFILCLIEFGFFYLSIALIRFFYEIDMIEVLLRLAGRNIDAITSAIFPTFVFGYGCAQVAILHMMHLLIVSRFGFSPSKDFLKPFYWAIGLVFIVASVILAFFFPLLAYLFLAISCFWSCFALIKIFEKPKPIPIILLIIGLFLTFIIAGLLYRYMPPATGLILYGVIFVFANISSFLNDILLRKKK